MVLNTFLEGMGSFLCSPQSGTLEVMCYLLKWIFFCYYNVTFFFIALGHGLVLPGVLPSPSPVC